MLKRRLLIVLSLVLIGYYTSIEALGLFDTDVSTVALCNSTVCHGLKPLKNFNKIIQNNVIVYQTSNKPEFLKTTLTQFSKVNNRGWQHIIVNQNQFKDTPPIIGFGGSFSDSSAILFKHMSEGLRENFLKAYFSNKGSEYSLARVPIASVDFSCRGEPLKSKLPNPALKNCLSEQSMYSYIDTPDEGLNFFSLQTEDTDYKIPMIKDANLVLKQSNHDPLVLFASPWSAPAWMKSNHSMIHGTLLPQFQQVWAEYIIRFLKLYKERGLIFWGLTVQNEPIEGAFASFQVWQTMFLDAKQESELIKYYIGPALQAYEKEYGSHINLMMHDDQIPTIKNRTKMVEDPEVRKFVDGAGFHWYRSSDRLYSNLDAAFYDLNKTKDRTRFLLSTEACTGYNPFDKGPKLGSWSRGESYAHDIISVLNHHASGWTDWNLVLDTNGGPNWAKNFVDAPILVDLDKQIFYEQPMYFYLSHFSKFIRPGSKLLASTSAGFIPLEEVTYKVPAHDGLPETIVITVLNRSNTSRKYYIQDITSETNYINLNIPPHAIQSIIYKANEI